MARKAIGQESRRKRRRRRRSKAAEKEFWEHVAKTLGVEPDDLVGQRVYIRKGYREWERRDELIRSEHRKDIEAGLPKMYSMKILARMFKLSFKRVQAIIYRT